MKYGLPICLALTGATALLSCSTDRPHADAAFRATAGGGEPYRLLSLDELPNRFAAYDRAIADLQKESADLRKKLAALEQDSAELRHKFDGESH